MRKTFKYRLYPTSAQRSKLKAALDACRLVYNQTLDIRKMAWDERQDSISLYDTNKLLTEWKRERDDLSNAFSQSLQDAQQRVDLAFKAFFRRVKANKKRIAKGLPVDPVGYPRFKSWLRYDSFTYKQAWVGFRLDDDRLYLSKIGKVKIKLHRPIMGAVKTLNIKRDRLGNWYAAFSCEVEPVRLSVNQRVVGVDVGLSKFAVRSDGFEIANPRFFKRDEKTLKKAARKYSRYPKGSAARRKYLRAYNHIWERIRNRRQDFAHKEARKLVNEFQIICLEKLQIQDMLTGNYHSMNRSIADVAWNRFAQYILSSTLYIWGLISHK